MTYIYIWHTHKWHIYIYIYNYIYIYIYIFLITEFPWWLSGKEVVAGRLPAKPGDMSLMLIQEDLICHRGTRPMCHKYSASRACVLEPRSCNSWSPCSLEPMLLNKGSHYNEKPTHHTWRVAPAHQLEKSPRSNKDPAQPKINKCY